jgi:16S rRNA (adenine(1408)-N(1))-methyltransferase
VYQSALRDPGKFFIGIDASARPLEKISEKIHRSVRKGGAPNALFLEAAVERLPEELNQIATEVHVQFPWGSLLHTVACGHIPTLRAMRRLCCPDAILRVVVGLDVGRDASEMARLGLPNISVEYIDGLLRPRYAAAGFTIQERAEMKPEQWHHLSTSWARRLKSSSNRVVHHWIAKATETPCS